MDLPDLMFHPVRLRIVHALSRSDITGRTTAELADQLPDVPRTSIYRHVGLLIDGAVLEVVGERRVRGGVERRLWLRAGAAAIDPDTAAKLTSDDHRAAFAAATASLLGEFNRYLDTDRADPTADEVGYRQGTVWLTPDERHELMAELATLIQAKAAARPAPGRLPHLMSLIIFPTSND